MEILSKFRNRLLDITKSMIGEGGVGIKFWGLENFKNTQGRGGRLFGTRE